MKTTVKTPGIVTSVFLVALTAFAVSPLTHAQSTTQNDTLPKVRMVTTEGAFVLQLRPDVAPATVKNFLQYVRDGFYNGTVFHRVIPGFMIQGGGFTPTLSRKTPRDPIANEATQSLPNLR
ncbi:MAG: peptidylprolyl isomerase, partial [Marinobacter sp.]|nr:peptidylprolyl isomerase [Marinobacter sp.]